MSNMVDSVRPEIETPGSAGDVAVQFESVAKRFGDVIALRGVSLSIRRGEFVTLLGPSGCGKTTLLNLIAGFFAPDGGKILVDGRLVNDVPTYKREIGIMFQNYALFPHMSVARNVGYGLKMRGVDKRETARRVEEALALVKLTGYEDRKPRQLSGGQQQRVALARALVIKPRVLLLDEPFSALDKNLRGSMQVELREIQRRLGVTTLFVTHDQGEALSLSDRVAVMSEGRILEVGAPEAIYSRPRDRFVASFVGDANVVRGRFERFEGGEAIVRWGNGLVRASGAPLAQAAPAVAVDLFLRPEQISVAGPHETNFATGKIAGRVFQGGYCDIYVESETSVSGRLIARIPAHDAAAQYPGGAEIGLSLNCDRVIAFAAV